MNSNRAGHIIARPELHYLQQALRESKLRNADLAARLRERDRFIEDLRHSWAWRLVEPLWKLQRHFSKKQRISTLKQNAPELLFKVDSFKSPTTPANALMITGWCFSNGGPEVVGVRAKIDGKSYLARYGLKRERRDDYLDPASSISGFSIIAPSSSKDISLEAITEGGEWHCFFPEPLPRENDVGKQDNNDEAVTLYGSAKVDDLKNLLGPLIEEHAHRVTSAPPLISVITPLFNINPRLLIESGASLFRQSYPNWEWCLLVPPSSDILSQKLLHQINELGGPCRVLSQQNDSLSQMLNRALEASTGEMVCFLSAGDLLDREALAMMSAILTQGYDLVYSDEDKFDDNSGRRVAPAFKPDWSPEYLRGTMYISHGVMMRRDLARRIRFNPDYDGVQHFEFMLRATEAGARVGHIPKVLYHMRKTVEAVVPNRGENSDIESLQARAVNDQLQRLRLPARAETGLIPTRLKIVPQPRPIPPRISIVIPTKDAPELLSRCLESLYNHTSYPNYEAILVDNQTTDSEALAIMRDYPVTRVQLPDPFNFSRANNIAAKSATGEYLVFLNNDTEIITSDWVDYLLYYAAQPDVGVAGALLLHENGTVQHAGVILGVGGTADHAMRGFSPKGDGYLGSLSCAREVSAITAACLMMRKSLFDELGGFDENFSTMYQDVDLCLRVRERGLRIIWTPRAILLHHESISRSKYYDTADRDRLLQRWDEVIKRGDPYYNPNLNLERGDYGKR